MREIGDEVLGYDRERNAGHCLNATAAAAWKLCDGKKSISELAWILTKQLSAPFNEVVVQPAIDELSKARLLVEAERRGRRTSRREAIRAIGSASAIALSLFTSLVAPTPAQVASCLANGRPCVSNVQCCTGRCVVSSGHCNA